MFIITTEMNQEEKSLFEAIYYNFRDTMFSYAFSIVKNPTDAEDVLHNAFLKLANNLKCIDNPQSRETAAFIAVITRNSAYDLLRKRSHFAEDNFEEDTLLPVSDNIIEDIIIKSEYEKIVSAIKSINSPYNEVLFLHYVKDFSISKTAKLLNRKPATVKMQLVRGKKLLLKSLTEECL